MANGRVEFGSGHLGSGPKTSHFKKVENGLGQAGCGSGWPIFFTLKKKKKKQINANFLERKNQIK